MVKVKKLISPMKNVDHPDDNEIDKELGVVASQSAPDLKNNLLSAIDKNELSLKDQIVMMDAEAISAVD